MKTITKTTLFLLTIFCLSSCWTRETAANEVILADKQATAETQQLFRLLQETMQQGILFGHQDDLAYGHNWYGEQDRSDVNDVCGDYPALIGWELGLLETGAAFNLDSVGFVDMKRYVTEAHRRGSINSFSWHGNNIATGGDAWDCKSDTVVRTILPGGKNHTEYMVWLDRVAEFFSGLTDDNGVLIAAVFRMYHEHTGGWFWWGAQQCTPEEYKQLWIMTVEYLRDTKGVHNLLYAYSPADVGSETDYLARYPGDEYVDIVGFDCYARGTSTEETEAYKNRMDLNLKIVCSYADSTSKIPIIGETGLESIADTSFFTQTLYPIINRHKISSVLLWRNAFDARKKDYHFYVPFTGHPAAGDFRRFIDKPDILMSSDLRKNTGK